jgi:hypothetical protein
VSDNGVQFRDIRSMSHRGLVQFLHTVSDVVVHRTDAYVPEPHFVHGTMILSSLPSRAGLELNVAPITGRALIMRCPFVQ